MSEFYINLLNAAGVRVGDGPLAHVLSIDDTRKLDAIGSLQFTLPATDQRAQYITAGAQFDVFDKVDRYLGRFYYQTKQLEANSQAGPQLVVQAHDQLIELARSSVHFRRTYTQQAVDDVIEDLIEIVAGWTAIVDSGIGTTSVMYEGESVLRAVDVLRDRWGQHFRLGDVRQFEFGAFGETATVTLSNLLGQVQSDFFSNENIALVNSIGLVEEADDIFNKLVPLGAGQGVAQLTIETADLGSYAVEEGLNADGSSYWYIADSASIAQYGQRERVLTLPSIRPITNSEANIRNAANALKLSAEAYMARHLAPRVTYAINVRGLRQNIAVGSLVHLQYRGAVENYVYVDVDDYFYVMEVTRRRNALGNRSATLQISTLAERRTSDTDIVLDVINDLRALKINIPITLTYGPIGPHVRRIDSTHSAEFTVRIGDEVTFLNHAILRFKTEPLKSSVVTVSTVSGTLVSTESAEHDHNVTASGSHQHSLTVSSSGSHSHTISITSSGLGSSGSSSVSTTDDGSDHFHEITVNPGGPSGEDVFITVGGVFNTISGINSQTDAESAPHTHGMEHTHNIDHGHSGSTASNEPHTHTGQTTDLQTHDHNIAASGSHTHDVDVAGHNHDLTYGIFLDTVYPQTISVAINGIDVTSALGGPWALTNVGVQIETDITEYIVNASGGLRQNHEVVFTCAAGRGEIEGEIDILASIQPITV